MSHNYFNADIRMSLNLSVYLVRIVLSLVDDVIECVQVIRRSVSYIRSLKMIGKDISSLSR
jgi:hypothetical protein